MIKKEENMDQIENKNTQKIEAKFVKDEDGVVVAVFDYYYKRWVDPRIVEFGAKANSATGLNSMCKWGVSNWTKQQNAYKKAQAQLLDDVKEQKVKPSQIGEELEKLEAAKTAVAPFPVPECAFETAEELAAADYGAMEAAMAKYLASLDMPAEDEEEEAA